MNPFCLFPMHTKINNNDQNNNSIDQFCNNQKRNKFILPNNDTNFMEAVVVYKSDSIKEWNRGTWDKVKLFSITIEDMEGEKGFVSFYGLEADKFFTIIKKIEHIHSNNWKLHQLKKENIQILISNL